MNPDDASWRVRFTVDLRKQIADTHTDGAFLDSASVPNEFGGSAWTPPLPDLDLPFEHAWTKKLERWLPFVQRKIGKPVIANARSLITTRDHTDYSHVAVRLGPRAARVRSLVQKHRIVICQDDSVLPSAWRLVRSAPPATLAPRTAAVLLRHA